MKTLSLTALLKLRLPRLKHKSSTLRLLRLGKLKGKKVKGRWQIAEKDAKAYSERPKKTLPKK
jgi:hypothetical protein